MFHVPSPRLGSYGATYSFKAPLPLPEFFRGKEEEEEDEAEQQEPNAEPNGLGDEDQPVQVTINAGIVGNIARPKQKATVQYEDNSTEEIEVCDQYD